jgi:hypothetical protein
LGWQKEWQGFAWKLQLYLDALRKLPLEEPVICVDGYDVVVIAPAEEMLEKFKKLRHRMVFSGQRYFPNQKWIQRIADQVMSNNISTTINQSSDDTKDYTRPCMGLLMAYAGDLAALFESLLAIEKERSLNDDQTLLNIHYLNHPDSLYVDKECLMFQNLWRTRGGIYGKISSKDKSSEVEVFYDETIGAKRIRNKMFDSQACLIHAPFNLDMDMLLDELDLDHPTMKYAKGWHYWKYSLTHHISRAIKFYFHSLRPH